MATRRGRYAKCESRARRTHMPDDAPEALAWTCAHCGAVVTRHEEVVVARGHYWHTPCFRDIFPAPGRLIPSTLNPRAVDPFTGGRRER